MLKKKRIFLILRLCLLPRLRKILVKISFSKLRQRLKNRMKVKLKKNYLMIRDSLEKLLKRSKLKNICINPRVKDYH